MRKAELAVAVLDTLNARSALHIPRAALVLCPTISRKYIATPIPRSCASCTARSGTPRDREALLLWDAGMSYDEIATQTGLARGAIGTTLARARRRLVEAYDAGIEGGQHAARG